MKIQPIKNYSIKQQYKVNFTPQKTNEVGHSEPLYFRGNPQVEISGISEAFFGALMKTAVSEKEIETIKKEFLLVDGKFSPQLAMLYVQVFNYGADRRKKDSPGMSLENKNAFASEFAQNVFYANKDVNEKYNFSNFNESLNIIYEVQKSRKIEDMLNFIYCSKDEKSENFQPDVARAIYKIMTETEYTSPIDVKFYIEDYCRDLDGDISDDNIDSLIKLMKVVGGEHVDAYSTHVYNKESKEFIEDGIDVIQTMLDYFLSEECLNRNYNGFVLDVGKFMFAMLTICKNPETNFIDKDLFDAYFQDIRFAAEDDFQKMMKKLFHPGEDL